jgi:hypothetical protein
MNTFFESYAIIALCNYSTIIITNFVESSLFTVVSTYLVRMNTFTNTVLVYLFEHDYSTLLFYLLFILIELRILLLLQARISSTEDTLCQLQDYCTEVEKKLTKYNFIENHNEIRNLRSYSRTILQ